MRFLAPVVSILLLFALPTLCAASNETDAPPAAPAQSGLVFGRAIFANGSPVQSSPLTILARSSKSATVYRLITDQKGNFLLSLSKGQYEIDALLDLHDTPGIDFASTTSLDSSLEENTSIIFYPAGSIAGKAIQSGSPVPGARVHVSCPSDSFDYERINGAVQANAGEAGEFMFRALPTGTCVVSAYTGSLAGSSEIQVEHGKVASAEVEMRNKASTLDLLALAIAAAVALAAIIFITMRFFGGKKEQPPSPAPQAHGQASPLEHMKAKEGKQAHEPPESKYDESKVKAVLSTLSEREREIAKFLIKSGGRAKRSQLQHKLLIPKTSLLRNLRSLERKNIVKLTPFGRNLLAELQEQLFR